jgi:MFS transporter, PPP family, 3-phenylpropionic acid transporter
MTVITNSSKTVSTSASVSATGSWYDTMLVGPKILYFFAFLQQYSFYGFRSVFFKSYFLYSPFQTGTIYSASAAASFVGMTVWSNTADSTRKPKMVFMILVLGSMITFISLYFKSLFEGKSYSFWLVLSVICVYSFFNFGMNPILSHTVLEILNEAGEVDKSIYGRQVVFGSFAYIISNFCQGYATDLFGVKSIFTIFLFSSLMLIAAVIYAFPSDNKDKVVEKAIESKKIRADIIVPPWWHVLRSPRFVLFLTVIFLTGCARSIMSAFLPIYCKENLKLTGLASSLVLISGVTLEMLSFAMAPMVSGLGPYWMLVMAQVIMAVRAWAYVYVPADSRYFGVFLLIELLKGAAFGLTHLAGVRIARESAPEGLEATAQGFYEGFYAQIPAILSVPLGGMAISVFGFSTLFKYTAVGISFSCALVIFIFWQNGKLRK